MDKDRNLQKATYFWALFKITKHVNDSCQHIWNVLSGGDFIDTTFIHMHEQGNLKYSYSKNINGMKNYG